MRAASTFRPTTVEGAAPPLFTPDADLDWQRDANCDGIGLRLQLLGLEAFVPFGYDLFFPADGKRHVARIAKAVCARCLVRDECLTYALDHYIRDGIWGGTTLRQREPMWRARRRLAT